MYLKLIIPSFYVQRDLANATYVANKATATTEYQSAYNDYIYTWKFMYVNMQAYRDAYNVCLAENINNDPEFYAPVVKDIVFNDFGDSSRNVFNPDPNDSYVKILNNFIGVIAKYTNYTMDALSMDYIAYSLTDTATKESILSLLNAGKICSGYFQKDVFNNYKAKKTIYDDYNATNRKFAWVDKLGHSIIDYVEVDIGGDNINKHYGDWINIWYELTKDVHMETIYNKMIGNVASLTTYDRTTKPSYTLLVPLQFWFCRNNGMAIPLVAMQFMDVYVNIRLKRFSECSYIELDPGETSYSLDDEYENQNLTITGSLMIDYIYLDQQERKKFAQSVHEYLIDQVQLFSEEHNTLANVQFDTEFNEPCKEFIWVLQKKSFVTNTTGSTKCRWDNYTYSTSNEGISLNGTKIEFNGQTIIEKFAGELFCYMMAYQNHTSTPSDGIYNYSFALDPEEHQPSGSCNMSRIKKANIILDIKDEMLSGTGSNIRVYAVNYNVLRFLEGMAGLAFV